MATVEAPPLAERNWLHPIPGQLWFPDPPRAVPGLGIELPFWLYAYECLVAKMRWHLGHPQIPVPPWAAPVAGRLPGGHKPRHRAERELARRAMTTEHCRRVVFTFWPRLGVLAAQVATLCPAMKEQTDADPDEHSALVEPDQDPARPAPPSVD